MNTNCVCKDCEKHCECELHDVYEHQSNGCSHGEHPIEYCEIKNEVEEN